jgi:hypothetical protein
MADIFRFEWPVDQHGYEIVQEKEGHRRVSVIEGRGGSLLSPDGGSPRLVAAVRRNMSIY